MNILKAISLSLILCLPSYESYAADDLKACIKYQRADYTWSHAYAVRGFTVSGSDLNAFAREKPSSPGIMMSSRAISI